MEQALALPEDTENKELNARLREIAEERESILHQLGTLRQADERQAGRAARMERLREFVEQRETKFAVYDDAITRKFVEQITALNAETIRIKFRYPGLEVDKSLNWQGGSWWKFILRATSTGISGASSLKSSTSRRALQKRTWLWYAETSAVFGTAMDGMTRAWTGWSVGPSPQPLWQGTTKIMTPCGNIRWRSGGAGSSGESAPRWSCWNGARYSTWVGSGSSPWAGPAATTSRTASWSRTILCSRRNAGDWMPGRDVPGEPPLLVERGVAQRGGVSDRQGQLGQCGLGGGLYRQPLLPHLSAGRAEQRFLQSRCPDRFPGGSGPTMPVQISVFWTLPHQPGHTGKICPAVWADYQIERVRADRNVSDTSEALLFALNFSFTEDIIRE